MYDEFYRFNVDPFRLSPDHRFSFGHPTYAKAKAYIQYALNRAEGFVMVTGKPGTGKTTLINDVLDGLPRTEVAVATLVSTQLEADDLLRMVAYSFGLDGEVPHKALVLQRVTEFLNREQEQGRRALLIIDEAQDLSVRALEELRLLTNLQGAGRPLLQIVLLGQEGLRELVRKPEMEQVHQRLVAACDLEPLGVVDGLSYVLHRLLRAGWRGDPVIEREAWPILYEASEGVPRRINLVCSRLLLHGCVEERHTLTAEDAAVVAAELQRENLAPVQSGAFRNAVSSAGAGQGGREELSQQEGVSNPEQVIGDPRKILDDLLSAHFEDEIPKKPNHDREKPVGTGEPQPTLNAEPAVIQNQQESTVSNGPDTADQISSPSQDPSEQVQQAPPDYHEPGKVVSAPTAFTGSTNIPSRSRETRSAGDDFDTTLNSDAADNRGERIWGGGASISLILIVLGGTVLYFQPEFFDQKLVWLEQRINSAWRSVNKSLKLASGIHEIHNSTEEDEQSNRRAHDASPSAKQISTNATASEARSPIVKTEATNEDTLRASRILDEQPGLQTGDVAAKANRPKWSSNFDLASFRVYRLTDVNNTRSRPNVHEKLGPQTIAGVADANWSVPILATADHYGYHRIEYDMPTDAARASNK